MIAIIIAYFVQNLFVFDSLAVTTAFFFLLAYLESKHNSVFKKEVLWKDEKNYNWLIISGGAILLIYFVLGVNLNHYNIARKNYSFQKNLVQGQNLSQVNKDLEKLFFDYPGYLNKDSVSMITDRLVNSMARINSQEKAESFYLMFNFLIERNREYLEICPEEAYLQLNLARLYMAKASMLSSEHKEFEYNLEQAKKVIDVSIDLSPQKLHNYYFRSQINLNLGKIDEAIQDLEKAIEFNEIYGTSYWLLANAYMILEDKQNLIQENIAQAIEYNHRFSEQDLKKALGLYGDNNYLEQRIFLYEKLIKIDPQVQYYNELGRLYQEIGDFEKAEKALSK